MSRDEHRNRAAVHRLRGGVQIAAGLIFIGSAIAFIHDSNAALLLGLISGLLIASGIAELRS